MANHFSGFTPATVNFLKELKNNNTKTWFDAHKSDYEKYVKGIQNTTVDLAKYPASTTACIHEIQVRINLLGAKQYFSSCEQDGRSLLVAKLMDLVRDLYYEP